MPKARDEFSDFEESGPGFEIRSKLAWILHCSETWRFPA